MSRLACRQLLVVLTMCTIHGSVLAQESEVEVRHIDPPKLHSTHLGEEVLCHRPKRYGGPMLKVEKRGRQLLAHNYGHGGSGWTLAPGSASYVNDLFVRSKYARHLSRHSKLTVVGAGALGLFTAYDLYKRGFRQIEVVAASFEDLTSHNAGGLLAPTSGDNAPEIQAVLDEIGFEAYRFYESIALGNHPDFAEGARIMPVYFRNRKNGLAPYVGQVMAPPKDVILDFGNGTQQTMVAYDDGIFIDAGRMLELLRDFLASHGVGFRQRWVKSFSELPGRFIFNCTGLGSKKLNNDPDVVPVQGHLVLLRDQEPADMEYMVVVPLGPAISSTGLDMLRFFYMFPKRIPGNAVEHVGVVGGTFIEGATAEAPHMEEFDILLDGARAFYGLSPVDQTSRVP